MCFVPAAILTGAGEFAVGAVVEIFLFAMAVGLIYRVWGGLPGVPKRQVITQTQRGVVLQAGKVERVLDPGTYWIGGKRTFMFCDMRPKPFQLQAQAATTADGLGVLVSLAGETRVTDPAACVSGSNDAFASLMMEVRQAVHRAIVELQSGEVLGPQSR
jgi:regulator of protease activity HflC (stomatin/prohibitin superfamily)